MSSYSSSSLDDPLPAWTAYCPKAGVSWSPKIVHVYDDSKSKVVADNDLDNDDDDVREKRPLRRRGSALSLSGGLSSVFGSLSNILGTPKLSRRNTSQKDSKSVNSNNSRLKTRTMSDSALALPRRLSLLRRKNAPEKHPIEIAETPVLSHHRMSVSRESLPSVNSDGAKSSMDSADGSSKTMDVFDSSTSPGSSPEMRVPKNGDEPSFFTCDYGYRGVNIQNLVEEDVTAIALDRRCLKTGRLVLNEVSKSVCCGSVRTRSRRYPSCTHAATIHIYKDVNTRAEQIKMIKKIAALRRLRHRHIVQVFGLCIEGSPITPGGVEVLVATQRAHFHLTLRQLLYWTDENNPKLLTPRIITSLGVQICHGLKYLEKQKIIHTNLTTATVLLDCNCICKINDLDFGPIEDRRLNTRWLPLETFLQSVYTYKSVVWTFGVVLWEMITLGLNPYPHLTTINDIILYLAHGKRLIRPDNCPRTLYRIMCRCWDEKPRQRPTFDDLVVMLTSFQQSLPPGRQTHEVFPDRDEFWEDNSWMDELDGVYDLTMM